MVWRLLLRDLVGRAARQALSEQLARAAATQSGKETDPSVGAAETACRFGLVFALGIEAGGTEDLLEGAQYTRGEGFSIVQGLLAGRRVAIMQSGVGGQAAALGTTALIAGHRPDWIISAGLAGGLCDDVARGDFVFADAIIGCDGSRSTLGSVDRRVIAELETKDARKHVGTLLTTDRPIRDPAEKRALGERYGALAVDMESLAVAEVCAHERTRLLSVRIISDTVDDKLPPEIERLLSQKSAARRVGAALGAVLNRPGSFSEMLKLKEQALEASDRLGRILAQIVQRLD